MSWCWMKHLKWPEVPGVWHEDSRQVRPGDGWVARSTHRVCHLEQALHQGARCAVVPALLPQQAAFRNDPRVWVDPEIAHNWSQVLASCFPQATACHATAITGTNGKTSVSFALQHLLRHAGHPCARLGSLGTDLPGWPQGSSLTTPANTTLHQWADRAARLGSTHVVLEASSHGLDQNRLASFPIHVAVITNLSHEHLDYHGTMEAYAQAKARLLHHPGVQHVVLGIDHPWAAWFAQRIPPHLTCTRYGTSAEAEVRVHEGRLHTPSGVLSLPPLWQHAPFQAHNVAAAVAVAQHLKVAHATLCQALHTLPQVPGRLQILRTPQRPTVCVDHAHKPEAFKHVLLALRQQAHAEGGLLWVVFGCGGDRDVGKRPLMGQWASTLADRVVLTNDNPRTEDPQHIINQIAQGCVPPAPHTVMLDRTQAIRYTLQQAGPKAWVLLAGRGDEQYPIAPGTSQTHKDMDVVHKEWGCNANKATEHGQGIG